MAARTLAKCGVERWDLKTLTDEKASEVDFATVNDVTVKELARLRSQCTGLGDERRRPEEFKVYSLSAVIRAVRHEDDRDFHIVLMDPEDAHLPIKQGNQRKNRDKTLVIELVDPRCPGARDSDHLADFRQARDSFFEMLGDGGLSTLDGTPVKVRGVGLFDREHGQTGMAKSCLELHPILAFDLDLE